MRFCIFLATATIALLPVGALADIAGVASVVDADTLEIHGQRIRLHGIDAPESDQRCQRPDGASVPESGDPVRCMI